MRSQTGERSKKISFLNLKKKSPRNGLRDKRHELTISIFANVEHRLLSRLFNVIGVRPLF